MEKKLPSLENFYTDAGGGFSDKYQVWADLPVYIDLFNPNHIMEKIFGMFVEGTSAII